MEETNPVVHNKPVVFRGEASIYTPAEPRLLKGLKYVTVDELEELATPCKAHTFTLLMCGPFAETIISSILDYLNKDTGIDWKLWFLYGVGVFVTYLIDAVVGPAVNARTRSKKKVIAQKIKARSSDVDEVVVAMDNSGLEENAR